MKKERFVIFFAVLIISTTIVSAFSLSDIFNFFKQKASLSPEEVIPDYRVLYLKFDEPASSARFKDNSSAGNDASCPVTYCPTSGVPGKRGRAVNFQPDRDILRGGDRIIVPNDHSLDLQDQFTIALWVKLPAFQQTAPGGDFYSFVSKQGSNSDSNFWLRLQRDPGQAEDAINFRIQTTSNPFDCTLLYNKNIQDNQWHHLAAVFKRGQCLLYLDGSQVDSDSMTGTPGGIGRDVVIGKLSSSNLNGTIDELVIYNISLTLSEIQQLENSGADSILGGGSITNPPAAPPACIDSDGGVNLYVRGTMTINGERVFTDTCQDNTYLFEQDCGRNNRVTNSEHLGAGGTRYLCPEGCDRANGKCINSTAQAAQENPASPVQPTPSQPTPTPAPIGPSRTPTVPTPPAQTCTDSDELNYYLKGHINFLDPITGWRISEDTCQSDNILIEYSCQDNEPESSSISCSNGCFDGACLPGITSIINQEADSRTPCQAESSGLVAAYSFESTANDSSSHKYHGEKLGNITFVEGLLGQAASFPGNKKSYIVLPNNILNNSEKFSVSLWIKSAGSGDGIFSVARKVQNNEFLIYDQKKLSIFFKGSRTNTNTRPFLNDNAWHHLVVTVDSSNKTLRVFVDGAFKKENHLNNKIIKSEGIILGQDQDKTLGWFSTGQAYSGLIDEIEVYNKSISQEEVIALYNEGNGARAC